MIEERYIVVRDEDEEGPVGSCVPQESPNGVDDRCGVWVASTGHDANAGLQIAPVRTIAEAIERVWYRGKRIYVCAETLEEELVVPGGYTIYGGLDCKDGWRWIGDSAKTTLTAPAGAIPLSLRDSEGWAQIEDFHILARSLDPENEGTKSKSSIAVMAKGVLVRFVRSLIEAGDGAPGADGGADWESAAPSGHEGNPGNQACLAAALPGGAEVVSVCGTPEDDDDDSAGGRGGDGRISAGDNGVSGLPLRTTNPGEGEFSSQRCTDGRPGAEGEDGEPGGGAAGFGWITPQGYIGVSGHAGKRGRTGQGGGGGGGAKGGSGSSLCPVAAAAGGASGGSGGSGGCGGIGGKGGRYGGSSIGLVSLGSLVQFQETVLKAGNGGNGGDGGEGQSGGAGGAGGPGGDNRFASGLRPGCAGGSGGSGGKGGKGGGGSGGHAVGIAYIGEAPEIEGLTLTVGEAGAGGLGASPQHNGQPGVQGDLHDFRN